MARTPIATRPLARLPARSSVVARIFAVEAFFFVGAAAFSR